jgi:hypothetical protein
MLINTSIVTLVTSYKPIMQVDEEFSLAQSLCVLQSHFVRFIAPKKLSNTCYTVHQHSVPMNRFSRPCFESIVEFSRHFLGESDWAGYEAFRLLLILNTYPTVIRDELDFWCAQSIYYVGTPWPNAYEPTVHTGLFKDPVERHVHIHFRNDTLSQQHTHKDLHPPQEIPLEEGIFVQPGFSEDFFFLAVWALSADLVMSDEVIAPRLLLERQPTLYFHVNGGHLPMSEHTWGKWQVKVLPPIIDRYFPKPFEHLIAVRGESHHSRNL